jgi:hypothetical protein
MTARTQRVVLGVALLIVLGLVALYWFNSNLTQSTVEGRGPKTWLVQPGETLTLTPDEVRADDRYRCPGHPAIDFTPHEGTGYTEEGGLSVATTDDSVTVSCEAPGNA